MPTGGTGIDPPSGPPERPGDLNDRSPSIAGTVGRSPFLLKRNFLNRKNPGHRGVSPHRGIPSRRVRQDAGFTVLVRERFRDGPRRRRRGGTPRDPQASDAVISMS